MQEKNVPGEKKPGEYPETGKQGGQGGQGDVGKKGGDLGKQGDDFGKGDINKGDQSKKVGQ